MNDEVIGYPGYFKLKTTVDTSKERRNFNIQQISTKVFFSCVARQLQLTFKNSVVWLKF